MVVFVEDQRIIKPFLGGWHNKISDKEYLNAESQTGPAKLHSAEVCSRLIQTAEIRDETMQTPYERGTQMFRRDCYVSNESDKYISVTPYKSFEEIQHRLDFDGKARIIQRNYRAYKISKLIQESAQKYRDLQENCWKYYQEKSAICRKRHQQDIINITYPTSRADFDMLYDIIEKFRQDRLQKAKIKFFKAGRCAENYMILQKIVEMLNVVDKKKQALKEEYKQKECVKFLVDNCKPIRWNGYKGKLVEMITMKTQRAREFYSIYQTLTHREATSQERIEILIMLKKSLGIHNCISVFDLLESIDQELILLSRGMEDVASGCFRERIAHKYLRFLRISHNCGCENVSKDLQKNPEDEKLGTRPELGTKLCRSCLKLLPYYRFAVHGRIGKLSSCVSCASLRQRNISHVNYGPYVYILNQIRAEERRRRCYSALAFMMQKEDIYHLVNNIWHGRSVISKDDDIFTLKLIRYDKNVEWSPWNCILLTDEEAEVHCRIKDTTMVYSKHLRHQISLFQQVAKNHFMKLSAKEKEYRESCHYYTIQDRVDYEPPMKLQDYYAV